MPTTSTRSKNQDAPPSQQPKPNPDKGALEERVAATRRLLGEQGLTLEKITALCKRTIAECDQESNMLQERIATLTKNETGYLDEQEQKQYQELNARLKELDLICTSAKEMHDRCQLEWTGDEDGDDGTRDDGKTDSRVKPITG